MEFKELADNLGLEEEDILELVELFVETCSTDVPQLEKAIEQNNIQAVVELSHSLKGASGNLGFMNIFELAGGIETRAREEVIDGAQATVQAIKEAVSQISDRYKRAKL